MAAKTKSLEDISGDKVYPKTKTSAVYDNSNVKLSAILADFKARIEALEERVTDLEEE